MQEPDKRFEENDHGKYEVRMQGAEAPITIKKTLDEAIACVKRM